MKLFKTMEKNFSKTIPLVKLKSNVDDGFANLSSKGSNFCTRGEKGSTASSILFEFELVSNGPGKALL